MRLASGKLADVREPRKNLDERGELVLADDEGAERSLETRRKSAAEEPVSNAPAVVALAGAMRQGTLRSDVGGSTTEVLDMNHAASVATSADAIAGLEGAYVAKPEEEEPVRNVQVAMGTIGAKPISREAVKSNKQAGLIDQLGAVATPPAASFVNGAGAYTSANAKTDAAPQVQDSPSLLEAVSQAAGLLQGRRAAGTASTLHFSETPAKQAESASSILIEAQWRVADFKAALTRVTAWVNARNGLVLATDERHLSITLSPGDVQEFLWQFSSQAQKELEKGSLAPSPARLQAAESSWTSISLELVPSE